MATLIYLAVQVRQNTAALQTASWQAVVSAYRESNQLRCDPATALAWAKGLTAFPELAFEERSLFATVMIDEALCFQGAYALYESGQLAEPTYMAYLDWFASIVATPGGSAWWNTVGRPIFVDAMVAAVDERLTAGELHELVSLSALQPDDAPVA